MLLGAMLYKILNSEKSIELLDKDELESMIKFSMPPALCHEKRSNSGNAIGFGC